MEADSEGFLYPVINRAECIHCGLCEKVCPMEINSLEEYTMSAFAVKNPNTTERKQSSSGGVFISLAKQILAENGVVFGAVFDKEWTVKHTYTECLDGIYPMMGSKYLQSRIDNCYQEAETFLKQDRKVLFVGSPCQIKGLRLFLQKDYENLLAVDFFMSWRTQPGYLVGIFTRKYSPSYFGRCIVNFF